MCPDRLPATTPSAASRSFSSSMSRVWWCRKLYITYACQHVTLPRHAQDLGTPAAAALVFFVLFFCPLRLGPRCERSPAFLSRRPGSPERYHWAVPESNGTGTWIRACFIGHYLGTSARDSVLECLSVETRCRVLFASNDSSDLTDRLVLLILISRTLTSLHFPLLATTCTFCPQPIIISGAQSPNSCILFAT